MKLTDLQAEWIIRGQRAIGLKFLCPTCPEPGAVTLAVLFLNPLGGGPAWPDDSKCVGNNDGKRWTRSGNTLGTLTVSPSVDCSACGHWHGFVHDGET